MNDRDVGDFIVGIVIIAFGFAVAMGAIKSTEIEARKEMEKQAIIFCIEKPASCKVKYDYFKLENSK